MAFNFNWSPLTADADFYERARALLTAALNKSPKPPIIVDDILVTEFNLGSVPPELEILEIGDLAEDRFRGIFKMCYCGDAFLTLKTRVQANPLNTYLFSKPSFTSPQPLAAASGLTIPLQITLSEIKLSAFIILVFSKQKGLTLVFRNDPLESLKVSSTFDSIQFVRDYLQRTIEGKLRDLMMDELPAIIHRLSLQLWCGNQSSKEEETPAKDDGEVVVNPFASPPLDAVDADGNLLDVQEIASLSLDGGAEGQNLFSHRSLIRLAALSRSHRTLSLFTPGIQDALFRAWAGPADRSDTNSPSPTPRLTKSLSFTNAASYSLADSSSQGYDHLPARPALASLGSDTTGLHLGSGRHSRSLHSRKRKTRVINLRKRSGDETKSEAGETVETASDTTSVRGPLSEPLATASIAEEPEEDMVGPPIASPGRVRFRPTAPQSPLAISPPLAMRTTSSLPPQGPAVEPPVAPSDTNVFNQVAQPTRSFEHLPAMAGDSKTTSTRNRVRSGAESDTSSVILEQAWIMKMAGEIARRVYDEKRRNPHLWDEREDAPPPAYEAT